MPADVAKKWVFHPDTCISGVTDAFNMVMAVVRQQRSYSRDIGMFMEEIKHWLNACHKSPFIIVSGVTTCRGLPLTLVRLHT